ncbi:unnamed protein product [Effrenium voratum]|nr:unnamed protein product [Effrenium voratum]
MEHESLDSSDIFSYLHPSVTKCSLSPKKREADSEPQLAASPSNLLARVGKRLKLDESANPDDDCIMLGASSATSSLVVHEFQVPGKASGDSSPDARPLQARRKRPRRWPSSSSKRA